jgi:metal-responsive CopG/Arc/MetJ family transcriptional regulator
MSNQRGAGIRNVSFTMPVEMADALERRAKMEMTNKSEIVRRAVMAFLPPQEVAAIKQSISTESSGKKKRA